MKGIMMLALAVMPLAVEAQVHKCEVGGSTIYQSQPCTEGNAIEIRGNVSGYSPPEIQPLTPLPSTTTGPRRSTPASASGSSYRSTTERRNAEVSARARGVVIAGMSEHQATSILGSPSSTRTTSVADRTCKDLFWRDRRGTVIEHHVRLCDGEVESYRGR